MLETYKDKIICEEICSIFFEQFPSCFKITPGELLLNDNYKIFYARNIPKTSIEYCAINTIQHLNLGRVAINFSYSYTREDLRGQGYGDKYFKERVSYFKDIKGSFNATIRIKNIPSLKIMFNNNFIPIANFKYNDGGEGLKFVIV